MFIGHDIQSKNSTRTHSISTQGTTTHRERSKRSIEEVRRMGQEEEAIIPTTYTHSLALHDTAKGLRVDVHVYANKGIDVLQQAFDLYKAAHEVAKQEKIVLAPVEVTK
jgi:hypothetical protein